MEHAKHIIRAVLLLVLIAVAFVVVRHFALPETFGMHGHYRFRSVAEHVARPPFYGAPGVCAECHDEEAETWSAGAHRSVSCEVCHAPLGTHVEADEQVAPMRVQPSYSLCGRCHQRLAARPKEFPQVALSDHVAENGEEMTERVCLECHDAHNPSE